MRFSKLDRTAKNGATVGMLLLIAATLLGAASCSGAPDSAEKAAPPPPAVSSATNSNSKPSAVQDILRMMDAGISKEVIKTYVENSPAFTLTVDDIIALKKHAVPDDITTALVKRMSEVKNRRSSAQDPLTPSGANRYSNQARFDPESYEFWWYHYAYPRTLASAYERLYPYAPLDSFQGYGPAPFAPRPGYPGAGL